MSAAPRIILASGSAIRADILRAAGVRFDIVRPDVDEDAIKAAARAKGLGLQAMAQALADAKALAIKAPGAVVIGADQIMAADGEGFDKPKTMEEAAARLSALQGKPHCLINAIAIARDGEIVFRNIDEPVLHLRSMKDDEIRRYLEDAGEEVLASVGAYQVEALGSRLFERIEGDYFAVLGLSLFPLLGYLRSESALDY
ncbi:MAG: Maf family protein [Parvularculaceae bacterium]